MLAVSFFFCHLLDQHCLYEGSLLPPANEVYEGYVFTHVCQSFCSQWGGGWWVCPIACWDTPPWDQRQAPPWDQRQAHPPGTRGRPPWDQRQANPIPGPRGRPPLGPDTPQRSTCWEIPATSGRYASYWNSILLFICFCPLFMDDHFPDACFVRNFFI